MKLKTGTFASRTARAWSSNRPGTYGTYGGCSPPTLAICGANGARLRANCSAVDVNAPSSSSDTHRLIANGFGVSDRISAMTAPIDSGLMPSAPNDPRPPKFDTAAVNRWDERPPNGPWMIG